MKFVLDFSRALGVRLIFNQFGISITELFSKTERFCETR